MARNERDKSKKRPLAVVTGASSGIGLEYAERLAVLGYDLMVVARRRSRLESVASQLEGDCGAVVEIVPADLDALRGPSCGRGENLRRCTRPRSPRQRSRLRHRRRVRERRCRPRRVRDRAQRDRARQADARSGARDGGAGASGAIVNVSSMASFQPNPYFATYGASKAYVTSFTEALAAELGEHGVYLQALCPGPGAHRVRRGGRDDGRRLSVVCLLVGVASGRRLRPCDGEARDHLCAGRGRVVARHRDRSACHAGSCDRASMGLTRRFLGERRGHAELLGVLRRRLKPVAPARPSATVILFRESGDIGEVLLVQRSGRLDFHGGAWVFPGRSRR